MYMQLNINFYFSSLEYLYYIVSGGLGLWFDILEGKIPQFIYAENNNLLQMSIYEYLNCIVIFNDINL